MGKLSRRIERLEEAAGLRAEPTLSLVVRCLGQEFALDTDRCFEILKDNGFLPRPIAVVDFMGIPDRLSATELECYLRAHGAEICRSHGAGSAPKPG